MNLPYQEGTWFALPLPSGGFATGVVARATRKGGVILCYFFGPRRRTLPTLREIGFTCPADAVSVLRVGDLGLMTGEWKFVGNSSSWQRADWTIPPFMRADPLSGRAWRVEYQDSDPNEVIKETPINGINSDLQRDVLSGFGAAAQRVDALLGID